MGENRSSVGYTDSLAQYILSESYDKLPNEAIVKAKELILDTVGCAFGGYLTRADDFLIKYVCRLQGKSECTIIGDGAKVPCGYSAGVNSQMANILDFDETYRNRGHPGASIVFCTLAAAERQKASGKDAITALVTGYEVATRIGEATHPSPEFLRKVWIQNFLVFGCVAAAGKLLNLSKEQIKHSIAIAGATAPTLNVHRIIDMPGSIFKSPNFWMARLAIEAVDLAKEGMTGFYDYLDSDRGYWVTVSDRCRWQLMTQNLGEQYNIVKYMALKPWSTCKWILPGIELVLEIMKKEKLGENDIEEIVFRGHQKVCGPPYNVPDPRTMWDACWSVPYSIAVAVLGYKPGPAWFAEETLRNSRVLDLASKIRIQADDEATKMHEEKSELSMAKIELRAKNQVFFRKTDVTKGDPGKPLNREEIEAKFVDMATEVISLQNAQKLASTLWNLEKLGSVQSLTRGFARRLS